MKIAVIAANGKAGRLIVEEAISRIICNSHSEPVK